MQTFLSSVMPDGKPVTVVTATWGDWKAAHPDTTIIAEDGGLGRSYSLDPLRGRDDNGPIFPVGDVDPRLGVHDDVIGVITNAGTPVAFPLSAALLALRAGEEIAFEDIRLELHAGGIRAVGADGQDMGSHQAFWFAWSQFHPNTELWRG